ncbi:MAG: pilus assembly protein PilM [Myxococcota bacterium]
MARILGLDIGPKTIRGTLVRAALRTTEIQRYLESELPPSTEGEGATEALRYAVQDMLVQLTPPPEQIIVAFGGREASLRLVELPAGAAKKVGEVLPFELDELVPFEMEDAVVDHQPVDQGETLLRVLAAAVPKERVGARLSELKDAGLDPSELAVGAASLDGLRHLVPALISEEPQLIVHIGAEATELCVLVNGACVFARTLTGGMQELSTGGRALHREIKRTLASYRAGGGSPLAAVHLCGDPALYPDAAIPWLTDAVGITATMLSLPDAPGAEPATRARFGLATALAGRATSRGKRLDLRQGEFSHTRTRGALLQHARLLAVSAACILLAFFFSIWARYSVLDDERTQLQAQLASVTEDVFGEETLSATQARELLEGGRRVADPLPSFTAYDVLDAVSASIPTDIKHDTRRLTIEIDDEVREGRFEIQGTVASIAERDVIAANFESHRCFNEIKRGPTTPGPRNEGLNYRLEAEIHCPGDEPVMPERERRSSRRRNRGNR